MDGKNLRAAVVRFAAFQIGLATIADDPRHGCKGFSVVDGRGLAIQTKACGERRLKARLAFFAFERFEQSGFFSADVCAETVEGMQLKFEVAACNVIAQVTRCAGLFQGFFKALIGGENFAVNVVVAHTRTNRVAGDDHAFNHDVGVVHQDVAVFERAWLAFVRIANDVFLAGELAGHEAPLEAGRKACTTTATQRRGFELGNHLILRHARWNFFALGIHSGLRAIFAKDFFQSLVAAARFVIFETPVLAIEAGVDLRVDVAAMEAGFQAFGFELLEDVLNAWH